MKNFVSFIILSLSALVLSSCHKDDEPVLMRHALLVYMVAENSLMSSSNEDIREMLRGKTQLKNDEEIILYVDGSSNPAIYQITNKTEGQILSDLTPVYTYSTNCNSCSESQLESFLSYVKTNYSVDVYSMLFWSHGSGWLPSTYSGDTQNFARRRSYGIDNGNNIGKGSQANVGNQMCITDLHKALQSFGSKFNYIMFDCCFMQSVEVDYELRDVAGYIIASPCEIPGSGADYEATMSRLFDESSFAKAIPEAYYNTYKDANEKASAYTEDVYGVMISAVDCSKLEALMQATRNIVGGHYQELMVASYDSINDYFKYDNDADGWRRLVAYPDFYDMKGIFKTLIPESEYVQWQSAFSQAVPYAYATKYWSTGYYSKRLYVPDTVTLLPFDHEQYGGVTMYIPLEKYTADTKYASTNAYFVNGYKQSSWAKDIGLDKSPYDEKSAVEY